MRVCALLLLVGCAGSSAMRSEVPAAAPPEAPTNLAAGRSHRRLAVPLATAMTCSRGFDTGARHFGLDLATAEGAPVQAAAGGTVVRTAPRSDYGRMVILDHGGGLYTLYAHLRAVAVVLGERVVEGAVVGLVGHTGNATGSHLHFEVLRAPGPLTIRPTGAVGIAGDAYRVDPGSVVSTTCD